MIWRVEVKDKQDVFNAAGEGILKDILDLGVTSVSRVTVIPVYLIEGNIKEREIKTIARELLVDKITQDYQVFTDQPVHETKNPIFRIAEIAYHPGVMDPVEQSTMKAIRDLGIKGVTSVRTAKKYLLYGSVSAEAFALIINRVLSNKLIQHVVDYTKPLVAGFAKNKKESHFDVVMVDLQKAKDRELLKISRQGQLFLNLTEMKVIQKYFRKIERNPTDCELETIAQTWSEHCYHKTFRGNIRFKYSENGRKKSLLIHNLLKTTIMKVTQKLKKPWCVSVFHDNAGVIKFDEETNVCFKVETHNHPSALEPFGGANTGVGGVIRDSLGTGLGAKPVCNTDVFCFAPPDYATDRLPAGTLHPKRVLKGVVSGVRDYGNKMGIPTVNGAVLFDDRFVGNPLVFCGNIGLMPKNKVYKSVKKGDFIVVAGGRTGRDGIHGATFSSGELTQDSEVISSGAVQIGDPIQEKKILDVLMNARDKNLYSAITDCGAGGLSSAVGEMGKDLGAKVDLEKVPLKYEGLKYTEIWISESQERMVLAVGPQNIKKLLDVFAQENVEATAIGEFTGTKRLELFYQGCQVCDLGMGFLHEGIPAITKEAVWAQPKFKDPKIAEPKDLTQKLMEVLSHYNICSKEWIIRQYDHEVQGASVIKPLVGLHCDGPSDASVLAPKFGSQKGIAVSNGINVRYGMIDPFWMAASSIDEAIRQVIAVGGSLKQIAILDNFCWGNPDKPDRLGSLVRAAQGCYRTALGYGVPFISGKDSLNNEFTDRGKSIAIPGTLLISAIGIIDDVDKTVTMDAKKAGNLIYCVGDTRQELGGSIYFDTYGELGCSVPRVEIKRGLKIFEAVGKAIQNGWVRSAHDCSEGGLAVTLAEMAFSGGLGAEVHLKDVPYSGEEKRNDCVLFSESNSRFIVEVEPRNRKHFERFFKGIILSCIGRFQASAQFVVHGLINEVCLKSDIFQLKEAWQKQLRW